MTENKIFHSINIFLIQSRCGVDVGWMRGGYRVDEGWIWGGFGVDVGWM